MAPALSLSESGGSGVGGHLVEYFWMSPDQEQEELCRSEATCRESNTQGAPLSGFALLLLLMLPGPEAGSNMPLPCTYNTRHSRNSRGLVRLCGDKDGTKKKKAPIAECSRRTAPSLVRPLSFEPGPG